MARKGIDVAKWNGTIDWAKVRKQELSLLY